MRTGIQNTDVRCQMRWRWICSKPKESRTHRDSPCGWPLPEVRFQWSEVRRGAGWFFTKPRLCRKLNFRGCRAEVRGGTSWFHALQRLRSKPNILSRRGGSLRPPEQSSGRKQLVSVIKIVILISAVTDWKNQLSCGRAQRPAPTSLSRILIVFAAVRLHKHSTFMRCSLAASAFYSPNPVFIRLSSVPESTGEIYTRRLPFSTATTNVRGSS